MEQVENKLIQTARDLLKLYGYYIDNLWHIRDVHFLCEQHNLARLSDEEAMEVFAIACEQFDGETGLSWPKLEQAVQTLVARKRALADMMQEREAL